MERPSTGRRARSGGGDEGQTAGARSRASILEAAAELFAENGVASVSLRQVAIAANVQLGLIDRHVGGRDDLIEAVFADLSTKLAAEIVDRPLAQLSFERQSTMGRWTMMLASFAMTGRQIPSSPFQPVTVLADVLETEYGLDERSARLRAAQVSAGALGWRLFEDFLVTSAGLEDIPVAELRDELTATQQRIGATPWPQRPSERG